jgi:hypothetical protein
MLLAFQKVVTQLCSKSGIFCTFYVSSSILLAKLAKSGTKYELSFGVLVSVCKICIISFEHYYEVVAVTNLGGQRINLKQLTLENM